jgi:hypothetical protein
MKVAKSLGTIAVLAAVAGCAYVAGFATRPVPPAPAPVEIVVGPVTPLHFSVENPTAVLLGEQAVPLEVLKGPITPAPADLIVPTIPK